MARYFLPQNSKIRTGVTHKAPQGAREGAREVRTFRIYRFDPDSGETPRLDSFELDIRSCGPMVKRSRRSTCSSRQPRSRIN